MSHNPFDPVLSNGPTVAVEDLPRFGSWEEPFVTKGDLFPVHAALMYNRKTHRAKVLLFSGGANEEYPSESILWDPETSESTSQFWNPPDTEDDLFCCHHCFFDDGKLLVMGGSHGSGEEGKKYTYIFDPESEEAWKKVGDMSFPRWYPTSVMQPNKKIVVFSGNAHHHFFRRRHIVKEVEVFSKTSEQWTTLGKSAKKKLQNYPSLHVVPAGPHAGKIFYSGTRWVRDDDTHDEWSAPDTAVFDGTWSEIAEHVVKNRSEGTSVLLPPAQQARVLVIGGGHDAKDAQPDTAEIIDLTDENPIWELIPEKMSSKRTNVNAVILPDQTVFVCGGQQTWKKEPLQGIADQVLECAIYDPLTEDPEHPWKVAASMTAPRQYHSVALLLPDGRVLAAGGITFNEDGDQVDQKTMEIYSPPYMFAAERPEITGAPDDIGYDQDFGVNTPDGGSIDEVVLVRPSAVTHHTNTEQRLVSLEFDRPQIPFFGGNLRVAGPSDADLAPPGYYMLFIVDGNRTPSVARFVRLRTGVVLPPGGELEPVEPPPDPGDFIEV